MLGVIGPASARLLTRTNHVVTETKLDALVIVWWVTVGISEFRRTEVWDLGDRGAIQIGEWRVDSGGRIQHFGGRCMVDWWLGTWLDGFW